MAIVERVDPNVPDEVFINHCKVYEFFRSVINGGHVLDVGSGNGYGSRILSEGNLESYTGIDYSTEAVTYSQKMYSQYGSFYEMDAHAIDLSDRQFDWVISSENLEHLKDPQKALHEKARVLKPDGFALIGTPNKEMFSPGEAGSPNPFHIDEFYYDQLLELVLGSFQKCIIIENTLTPDLEQGRVLRGSRVAQGRVGVVHSTSGFVQFERRKWDLSRLENSHSFMVIAAQPRPGY